MCHMGLQSSSWADCPVKRPPGRPAPCLHRTAARAAQSAPPSRATQWSRPVAACRAPGRPPRLQPRGMRYSLAPPGRGTPNTHTGTNRNKRACLCSWGGGGGGSADKYFQHSAQERTARPEHVRIEFACSAPEHVDFLNIPLGLGAGLEAFFAWVGSPLRSRLGVGLRCGLGPRSERVDPLGYPMQITL